ncbi:MAG: DUF6600 domain-containing protein [Verrucomicrobiota bacterium]
MKKPYLIPFAALILFAATGCDKRSSDAAKKIAELEQKNQNAADRQRELEQEIEDQKLAAERDAIERERVRIEEDRAELERQQGAAAAEQDQALREREDALYDREGKLEQFQSALAEKEDELYEQTQQLSDRDAELAGREALSFEESPQSEPVADYDMFYDSLSSYGSWFETPDYGYVWQPVVVNDSNWRPYCRGRWVCSDRGWTWISEEPFGWATYHYGRWTLLRGRGWIWVPGTEWAPCWVSWRENDKHIGWAPLPPETMAYRGHNWDSSVDVQFGIGALCYNFVELRYFGSSLYGHCLPLAGNGDYYQQTSNITYIHIENRQIICGGPKYKKVCEGIGRPLPFYRLEIDHHPRPSRDSLGLRPRIKGDRLVVSAPNMDVAWNDGLKPKRIKDRIETVTVERNGNLNREITDRYRQTREEGRRNAETAIVQLGGADQFDQRRDEKLQDNRRVADGKGRKEVTRDLAKNPERPQRDISNNREPERMARPADPDSKMAQVPDRTVRQATENRPRPQVMEERRNPVAKDTPRVAPGEGVKPKPEPRPQQQPDDRRVARTDDSAKQVETQREPQRQADPAGQARKEAAAQRQEEQAREMQRQARQNEAEQTRQAQQEAIRRRQDEQAQQQQLRAQREAEQAREAQQEAVRQQREQERAQQQALAQQREQERAQRQQQEDQQREMQRQQENARQQQQENERQRQQEENQRQQENARQRQQEENQRQRQQEESRQKQEKDQDEQRKRGR